MALVASKVNHYFEFDVPIEGRMYYRFKMDEKFTKAVLKYCEQNDIDVVRTNGFLDLPRTLKAIADECEDDWYNICVESEEFEGVYPEYRTVYYEYDHHNIDTDFAITKDITEECLKDET